MAVIATTTRAGPKFRLAKNSISCRLTSTASGMAACRSLLERCPMSKVVAFWELSAQSPSRRGS